MSKPTHYTEGSIEPIDYIVANDLDFIEGNIIKYVTRYKYKNGLQDLMKAKDYLDRLIKENYSLITKENIKSMEKELEEYNFDNDKSNDEAW